MTATSRMVRIRPVTNRFINPVTRRFAGRLPGFAIVTCRGRRSGATYHIPMNVFRDGDDYIFALTYGRDVQWVKNVLAAGECDLRIRGREVHLVEPRVFTDRTRRLMPLPVRLMLGLLAVTEFMRMRQRSEGLDAR